MLIASKTSVLEEGLRVNQEAIDTVAEGTSTTTLKIVTLPATSSSIATPGQPTPTNPTNFQYNLLLPEYSYCPPHLFLVLPPSLRAVI